MNENSILRVNVVKGWYHSIYFPTEHELIVPIEGITHILQHMENKNLTKLVFNNDPNELVINSPIRQVLRNILDKKPISWLFNTQILKSKVRQEVANVFIEQHQIFAVSGVLMTGGLLYQDGNPRPWPIEAEFIDIN